MKLVNIAAPIFRSERLRNKSGARAMVMAELRDQMQTLSGTGLDLLVLSEGVEAVGMGIKEAESLEKPGDFLKLYMDFARKEKCHVAGSLKLKEHGLVYNAIVFIDDHGVPLGSYRKTFLTSGELSQSLSPGNGAVTVDTRIGRLGGLICFDLNFGELRGEYARLKPDILVFSSMYHGGFVQSQCALECRSFFVSALPFPGGGVIDPLGSPVCVTDCYNLIARTAVNLDRAVVHLDFNRAKFDDIERKYGDKIQIRIPANIGPAIIYSNSRDFSAADIVREFGLELLDDYFDRMRKANRKAGRSRPEYRSKRH
jgi:predicted amidohydrolase